jgi:D-alanine-D-alanine ligase
MDNIRDLGRVGVLSGGLSSERAISIRSADTVYRALTSLGIDAVVIDVTDPDSLSYLLISHRIDIAFIALHGRFGEDGTAQSLLEAQGIAYTGSGPRASRLALDKALSKDIFRMHKIPTPDYLLLEKKSFTIDSVNGVNIPCVIKPCNEGSSIGTSIVEIRENIAPAIEEAFIYDDRVIIEDYAEGVDITVGILDEKPLPIISISPKDRFYNYHAKYAPGASDYTVPADLPDIVTNSARSLGIMAHKALGCESVSRVDMIWVKKKGMITVLEVNTIPGFTKTSLLPKAAAAAGMDFPEMCLIILKHAVKKRKRYAYGKEREKAFKKK